MSEERADIVERLRDRDAVVIGGLFYAIPMMLEAANEIERLRREIYMDTMRERRP